MSGVTEDSEKVRKADATRQKIVAAALELFTEKGYEQATMRAIAQRAGVSVGNAYYYYASKEELMQGYYAGLYEQFNVRAEQVFEEHRSFNDRLTNALLAWVDNASAYHEFAGTFFKYAANPQSPLSPFSPESAETRNASIALYERLIEGSKGLKMADEVRAQLPHLLWMYQMGIVLFWVYDDSDNQEKTRMLITQTVPLVGRLLNLSRLPVLKSTTRDVTKLIAKLLER